MRVAIDVDGVIADFTWAFTGIAVELGLLGRRRRCSEQNTWHFEKGREPFPADPVWEEFRSRWNWWLTLEPFPDIEATIPFLNQAIAEHDVFFVTSRVPTKGLAVDAQTRYWLEGLGVNMPHAGMVVVPTGQKGLVCRGLRIDVAIDDCPDNLMDLINHDVRAIARRWQYNRFPDWGGEFSLDLGEFLWHCTLSHEDD